MALFILEDVVPYESKPLSCVGLPVTVWGGSCGCVSQDVLKFR